MIEITKGNILKSDVQALVNTVNCVGVMGRGIALQFKKAFPENFKAYKSVCDRNKLHPGNLFVFDNSTLDDRHRYIINFPTKRHWKGKSKIEDIQTGLVALRKVILKHKIHSIAIPPLGCGLGGLDWSTVRKLIEETFEPLPSVQVYLYEPKGAPSATEIVNRTKRPKMTVGRAALLELAQRYLAGLMDISVSLLELHKLMYFMQESGQELKLKYSKETYGPYVNNLGYVLNRIEGHFVTGYGDGGDDPNKQIELIPEAVREANLFIKNDPISKSHFERVSNLIDGFETPYGMELLATVHWAAIYGNASTLEKTVAYVHNWNDRKKQIPNKHIKIAWDQLDQQGWLIGK